MVQEGEHIFKMLLNLQASSLSHAFLTIHTLRNAPILLFESRELKFAWGKSYSRTLLSELCPLHPMVTHEIIFWALNFELTPFKLRSFKLNPWRQSRWTRSWKQRSVNNRLLMFQFHRAWCQSHLAGKWLWGKTPLSPWSARPTEIHLPLSPGKTLRHQEAKRNF